MEGNTQMATKSDKSEQEPEAQEQPTQPAVEIRPVFTGVVQGTLLHDWQEYRHGQMFTTHDETLFNELMKNGALKSPTADAQAAETLLAQKNQELDALKQRIKELEAAARPRQ